MSQFTSDNALAIGLRDEIQSGNAHVAAPPCNSDVITKLIRSQLSTTAESFDDASISDTHCARQKPVCPCPIWKRAVDIAGSLFALAILWPLLLGVAVFIRCVSRGPVFFRQLRYGGSGRPFSIWKFRTMEISHAPARHLAYHADLMHNGRPLKKIDHEFEIILGGHFLRRYGIDELPQLFNVVRGEMSLVGPRPDVMAPSSFHGWRRRRFDVLPGITGLWQVSGKNSTTFHTMMRLDMAYVRRRSFWLDLAILLRTVVAVLRN